MKYYLAPDFAALHSAPYSAHYSRYQDSMLAPFWATIGHKTIDTLHFSFISKKEKNKKRCSSQMLFLLFFEVDQVWYISNKYQPPNNLAEHQYFYTRDLCPSLIWKKIGALHRKRFSMHPLFYHLNKIFLHRTPYFKNKLRSPSQNLLETSTYYYIFTSFDSGWDVLYFK